MPCLETRSSGGCRAGRDCGPAPAVPSAPPGSRALAPQAQGGCLSWRKPPQAWVSWGHPTLEGRLRNPDPMGSALRLSFEDATREASMTRCQVQSPRSPEGASRGCVAWPQCADKCALCTQGRGLAAVGGPTQGRRETPGERTAKALTSLPLVKPDTHVAGREPTADPSCGSCRAQGWVGRAPQEGRGERAVGRAWEGAVGRQQGSAVGWSSLRTSAPPPRPPAKETVLVSSLGGFPATNTEASTPPFVTHRGSGARARPSWVLGSRTAGTDVNRDHRTSGPSELPGGADSRSLTEVVGRREAGVSCLVGEEREDVLDLTGPPQLALKKTTLY